METSNETKNLITEAKNICLIPNNNEPESISGALALFYTLKELGKNVNLINDNFPEKLNFLVPSLDFISTPKNFVISIPRSLADISQVYYEKNENDLKIHLTIDKGRIKKEQISFYFQDVKPDLIITLGVKDFQKQLSANLDSFGFLLDSPILNIDTLSSVGVGNSGNKRFGKINLVEEKSISEIVLSLIKTITENPISKNTANCLLASLIIHYENFKNKNTNHEVFEIAAELIKRGALNKEVVENLYSATNKEVVLLSKVFQNLKTDNPIASYAILGSDNLENHGEIEIKLLVEKIKTMGIQNNLLVLWEGRTLDVGINGFLYSKKQDLVNKVAEQYKTGAKNEWVFLSITDSDINSVKEKIINLLEEEKNSIPIYTNLLT